MDTNQKIKMIRSEAKMSQKELAAAAKIPLRTLQRYELGDTVPKSDYLINICSALNVNVLAFTIFHDLITDHGIALTNLPLKDRIKTIRIAAGMSRNELAALTTSQSKSTVSITEDDIRMIEDGVIQPTQAALTIIATVLDVPADMLIPNVNISDSTVQAEAFRLLEDMQSESRPIYLSQLKNAVRLLNNNGIWEITRYAEIISKIESYRRHTIN